MTAHKKPGSSGWLAVLFLIVLIGGGTAAHQSTSASRSGGDLSTTASPGPATSTAPVGPPTKASDASTNSPTTTADPAGSFHGLEVTAKRVYREDYSRASFGEAWTDTCTVEGCGNHCDTRSDILQRDLTDITLGSSSGCPDRTPIQGTLNDPYTGTVIAFTRGAKTSSAVQIDHIFPLAAAFDLGAWAWTDEQRINFAEDPTNLLAVSGPANQSKSDSLPGTTPERQGHSWMPPNSAYHCVYAQKLIAVAAKYALPIDQASVPVLTDALSTCPAP